MCSTQLMQFFICHKKKLNTTIVKMFFIRDNLLSWYPTTDNNHAFNFLSVRRLQNEKLHVPSVKQQKAELCLNVCHCLITQTRRFKQGSFMSVYFLIFLNA